MAQIYISYYAGDADTTAESIAAESVIAERIETELKRHFNGKLRIFRDSARAETTDFTALNRELDPAQLLIVVIGTAWKPVDPVRHEIESALNKGTPILVILTDSATLPAPESLPETLTGLLEQTVISIMPENFYGDLRDAVQVVERMVVRPKYSRYLIVSILSVFIMILCAFLVVVVLNVQLSNVMESASTREQPQATFIGNLTATSDEDDPINVSTQAANQTSEARPTQTAQRTPTPTEGIVIHFDETPTLEGAPTVINGTGGTNPTPTLEVLGFPTPTLEVLTLPTPTISAQLPDTGGGFDLAEYLEGNDVQAVVVEGEDEGEDLGEMPDSNFVGSASVYVFHDLSYQRGRPLNIALQLYFDTINITATPRSAVTSVPVTQEATRPAVDSTSPTQTPAPARYVEQVDDVPPVVIASLQCPQGFTGCGDHPDVYYLNVSTPNEWAWSVIPVSNAPSIGQFTVQLWQANEDGTKSNVRLFTHSVTLSMGATSNNLAPVLMLIAGVVGVGLALIAWRMSQRRTRQALHQVDPMQPLKPGTMRDNKARPSAFISYRRSPSWGVAL